MLWSRQSTYIQPIVLQEGVHTIRFLLKSVTSEAPAFMYALGTYTFSLRAKFSYAKHS